MLANKYINKHLTQDGRKFLEIVEKPLEPCLGDLPRERVDIYPQPNFFDFRATRNIVCTYTYNEGKKREFSQILAPASVANSCRLVQPKNYCFPEKLLTYVFFFC